MKEEICLKAWGMNRAGKGYRANGRQEEDTQRGEPSTREAFPLKGTLILRRAAARLGS